MPQAIEGTDTPGRNHHPDRWLIRQVDGLQLKCPREVTRAPSSKPFCHIVELLREWCTRDMMPSTRRTSPRLCPLPRDTTLSTSFGSTTTETRHIVAQRQGSAITEFGRPCTTHRQQQSRPRASVATSSTDLHGRKPPARPSRTPSLRPCTSVPTSGHL